MKSKAFRRLILCLALLEGGWLAFDGGHALLRGDYVTPSSGSHAGRLGPWSQVVRAVGLEPRSTLVKSAHLALGLIYLLAVAAFARGQAWAWWGIFSCALATLWYLPWGTLLSTVQLLFLGFVHWRSKREAGEPLV